MHPHGNDILGNDALYSQLYLVTEVLGKFVSRAPRALTVEQLEQETGRSAKELFKLCKRLCQEQLLQPHLEQPQCWQLSSGAGTVTLEDAFRCVIAERRARVRTDRKKTNAQPAARMQREIDLLVTQAAMGINQNVFQYLRQFSLDCLKVSAGGMFPQQKLSFC